MTVTYAVAAEVADVRREPAGDSELVTQALMNTHAVGDEVVGEWTHVRLPDYEGWMHIDDLANPVVKGFTRVDGQCCATPLNLVAVVTRTYTRLYTDQVGDEMYGSVYLSTVLPLLDTTPLERVQVALPGEREAWLERTAASVRFGSDCYPAALVEVVTGYARAFIDVPYLWGGTTCEGIDCSGLVQLCYRMGGYLLPRDGDQQYDALPRSVSREEMREGDLIFFGRNAIIHVALALNDQEYIHAEGVRYNRVLVNSLNPASPHYDDHLAGLVCAIKRVVI